MNLVQLKQTLERLNAPCFGTRRELVDRVLLRYNNMIQMFTVGEIDDTEIRSHFNWIYTLMGDCDSGVNHHSSAIVVVPTNFPPQNFPVQEFVPPPQVSKNQPTKTHRQQITRPSPVGVHRDLKGIQKPRIIKDNVSSLREDICLICKRYMGDIPEVQAKHLKLCVRNALKGQQQELPKQYSPETQSILMWKDPNIGSSPDLQPGQTQLPLHPCIGSSPDQQLGQTQLPLYRTTQMSHDSSALLELLAQQQNLQAALQEQNLIFQEEKKQDRLEQIQNYLGALTKQTQQIRMVQQQQNSMQPLTQQLLQPNQDLNLTANPTLLSLLGLNPTLARQPKTQASTSTDSHPLLPHYPHQYTVQHPLQATQPNLPIPHPGLLQPGLLCQVNPLSTMGLPKMRGRAQQRPLHQ